MRKLGIFIFAIGIAIGVTAPIIGESRQVPAPGISQSLADDRYINEAGDSGMTGSFDFSLAALIAKAATADGHVVNRLFGDGRYLQLDGSGAMAGALSLSSSALPSLTFSNDPDTGIWRPSADEMRFRTGGGDRLYITNSGSQFTLNLTVPDATAATHALNRQTGDARYIQTCPPIVVMFSGGIDPYFNTDLDEWTTAGVFLFGGTTALGTPTKIKAIGYKEADPTSWDIRVLDITNATTIATKTGNTGTAAEIVDLGTLSNLPAAQAIFEFQIKRAGGGGGDLVFVHSGNIEF